MGNRETGKPGNRDRYNNTNAKTPLENILIESNIDLKIPRHATQIAWALELRKMSMAIIPTHPQSKMPAIKWKHSNGYLTEEEIRKHWELNPDHESAILPGENLAVLDADSKQAILALTSLEHKHGMKPSIIIGTSKGEHHYYRLEGNVKSYAKSFSTDIHPERIDVRTGRNPVMGPGSVNKKIVTWDANSFAELNPASQAFLDEIRAHNGHVERAQCTYSVDPDAPQIRYSVEELSTLLEFINPDEYRNWLYVGMVLHRETSGSAEGCTLYDSWSSKSSKYKGLQSIENKWRSFEGGHSNPVTIGTLKYLAREGGADIPKIFNRSHRVASMVREPVALNRTERVVSPFDAYNAVPVVDELEKDVEDERLVFGGLVAMGEATAIYADANTGKTLIILSEIIQSIRQGLVRAEDIIYVNLDDPLRGFTQKARLAQEFGFQMLGEGCQNFSSTDVLPLIKESVRTQTAKGKILIIDTATKVVNLMNKDQSREFAEICRSFTRASGTVVILAHTNKKKDFLDKSVYSGVADVRQNFDCTYIVDMLNDNPTKDQKTIKFSVDKVRSGVKSSAVYRYSTKSGLSYIDRLLSVELVNPEESGQIEERHVDQPDAACIDAIRACITGGINTKMKLVLEARTKTGSSRGKTEAILKKYTGSTPGLHLWSFEKAQFNNAQIYRLLTVEQVSAGGPPVSGFPGSPAPRPEARPAQAVPDDFNDEEFEGFGEVTF